MKLKKLLRNYFLSKRKYQFYSQLAEDFFIYHFFINQHRGDGRYLELGAFDGSTYSNTRFFEEYLNFTGILIEPSNDVFLELEKNRGSRNRLYNCAVSSDEGPVIFRGNDAWAGIDDLLTNVHRNYHERFNSGSVVKQAMSLDKILQDTGSSYLDFLSIDVEGAELAVLKSLDLKKTPVYIICIELDEESPDKDRKCREILINNGFRFVIRLHINEFWINDSYYRKDLLYKSHENSINDTIKNSRFHHLESHCSKEIFENIKKFVK